MIWSNKGAIKPSHVETPRRFEFLISVLLNQSGFLNRLDFVHILHPHCLQLPPLSIQDLVLLPHDLVPLQLLHLLFPHHPMLHVFLLIFLIDLLQKFPLQLQVLFLTSVVVPLDIVVCLVPMLLHVLFEHIIEPFVILFVELGQVGFLGHGFGVLLGDLLLTRHALVHPLHVVILVLHEGRDGQVKVFDLATLVLVIDNLLGVAVVEILGFSLVQLVDLVVSFLGVEHRL